MRDALRASARQNADEHPGHVYFPSGRTARPLAARAYSPSLTRVFRVALFPWAKDLYTLLAQPLLAVLPQGGQMIATDVVGVFLVPMKVALLVAFVIALPYVLFQIWAFVAPGLYTHEKRLVLPLIITSTFLFVAGMAFAYFLVFPVVFKFMASIAPEGVAWMTDIEKYLSFALTMFIAFGVTFEVPVAVVLLVRMNIVGVDKLREIRPYVIVGAFVVGAVFTPPDVISQLMLAVPLWVLYELGIIFASMMGKPAGHRSSSEAAPGERNPSAAPENGPANTSPCAPAQWRVSVEFDRCVDVAPGRAMTSMCGDYFSSRLGLGRLPTLTFTSNSFFSRITLSVAVFPGFSAAIRLSVLE